MARVRPSRTGPWICISNKLIGNTNASPPRLSLSSWWLRLWIAPSVHFLLGVEASSLCMGGCSNMKTEAIGYFFFQLCDSPENSQGPWHLGCWKASCHQASCLIFFWGLHRCPAWTGLFLPYPLPCYDQFVQDNSTSCCLHFQETGFLGERLSRALWLQHRVGIDLTHEVSSSLYMMDSSCLQGLNTQKQVF